MNLLLHIDNLIIEVAYKPMLRKYYKKAGEILQKESSKKIVNIKNSPPATKIISPSLVTPNNHRTKYNEIIP